MIIGMMLATFVPRWLALSLSARYPLPLALQEVLEYVPVAVLIAVAAPVVLAPQGSWWLSADNPALWAAASALLLARVRWRARAVPTWVVILCSCACFALLKWV